MEMNPQSSGYTVSVAAYEREAMFEKALTPSDVGKQHAEKHFPLGLGDGDAAGTLLAFEDHAGKCWRFRYSYWNSSQSYVFTKGWSRYVKEKRLHTGDVLYFQRHRGQPHRTFIGCRPRDSSTPAAAAGAREAAQEGQGHGQGQGEIRSNTRRLVRLFGVNSECQQYHQTTSSQLSAQQQH